MDRCIKSVPVPGRRRCLLILLAGCWLLLAVSSASALACTMTNAGSREYSAPVDVPLPAVGQRVSLTTASSYSFSGCSPSAHKMSVLVLSPTYDAATSSFYSASSAPGFGVRIRVNGQLVTSRYFDILRPAASGSWPVTFEVIRRSTASLVQGTAAPAFLVSICPRSVSEASSCPIVEGAGGFIQRFAYPAVPATCQLSDIAPPLATIRAGDLPAVGSTAAASAGFTVPMTCANGNMSSVPIRFTLKDAQATGNTSNELTPVPGRTTSSGIHLQLLRRPAGGSYAVQSMGASWTQTKTPTGTFPAPDLAVRYIRTGAITPGTIGSTVTLTLDYP